MKRGPRDPVLQERAIRGRKDVQIDSDSMTSCSRCINLAMVDWDVHHEFILPLAQRQQEQKFGCPFSRKGIFTKCTVVECEEVICMRRDVFSNLIVLNSLKLSLF